MGKGNIRQFINRMDKKRRRRTSKNNLSINRSMVDTNATEDEQVIDKLVGLIQEQNKLNQVLNKYQLSSLGTIIGLLQK